MTAILTWGVVLIGFLMTFLILLQEGKGGGLAGLGGTKAAGVEGVTNPIRRATAYMAALFFLLAIVLGIMEKPKESIGLAPTSSMTPSTAPKKDAGATKSSDAKPADSKGAAKPDAPKTDAAKTETAPASTEKTAEQPKSDEKKTTAPETK